MIISQKWLGGASTTGRAMLQAMGSMPASTRERILEQGLLLMRTTGLNGITLGTLADQVGMSKSGLFAHFRSKEDVQIGLLEYMARFAAQHVIGPSMAAPEGLPRLKRLVANWFGWAQRAGLPGGCPVAAGLFEFDDLEGAVRNKMLEMEGRGRNLLTGLVRDAISCGHMGPNLDDDQFDWELSSIYLSHHAAHRFLRSADADQRAEIAWQALIERALPVNTKRRKEK